MGEVTDRAAIDSTGMETRHVSAYYTKRCQRHKAHYKHRYPKLSAVCDVRSHLLLSAVVDRGPKPDHVELEAAVVQAARRQRIHTLLGDAGYESEAAHRFCRAELGIRSIFPTTPRGRPRKDGKPKATTGHYRQHMKKHFPKKTYAQRWQIETTFSMLKRLLGSALRGRRRHAIDREIYLRVITINLMIIWRLKSCFQQSRTVPHFQSLPGRSRRSPPRRRKDGGLPRGRSPALPTAARRQAGRP